jgi:hypothetical protein
MRLGSHVWLERTAGGGGDSTGANAPASCNSNSRSSSACCAGVLAADTACSLAATGWDSNSVAWPCELTCGDAKSRESRHVGISGGRSLTRPFRDARRFPLTGS